MNMYTFDIWDGDKGIIFAENEKQAIELYKKEYPDYPLAHNGNYDSGIGRIDSKICNVELKPNLFVISYVL